MMKAVSDEFDMGNHSVVLLPFFEDIEFDEDLFSIFDNLLESSSPVDHQLINNIPPADPLTPLDHESPIISPHTTRLLMVSHDQKSTTTSSAYQDSENDDQIEEAYSPSKRSKKISPPPPSEDHGTGGGGVQHKMMQHITVERNRRKQMNEHLSVLRTLMPKFYIKRGDQASIIEGVVDYIKELQQVLQSLGAIKQRKVYSHDQVLSPRIISSPRSTTTTTTTTSTILINSTSPRKPPPLSPRLNLPISPRTPQPTTSPYNKPKFQLDQPSCSSSSSYSFENIKELAAVNSKSLVADVEVKFSGPNVLLKTVSTPIPGQALKIIAALEALSLEILHVNISTVDGTMLTSFTIKIGIECQLSAEDLAHEIQQTFC